MNKLTRTLSAIVFIAVFTLFSENLSAQSSIGIGTAYGAEEGIGVDINGLYSLRENIAAGASAVWWPRSAPEGARYLYTELNAELRFIPYIAGRFSVHLSGITGYHYAGVRIESLGDTYRSSEHMTAIGGAVGASYDFGAFSLTGGARHFITGFNQLSVGLGVKIHL